jgi:hypothetical protein
MTSDKGCFPIYILCLDGKWLIEFPEPREDIGHTRFWEDHVSHVVARHYEISQALLENLPYCQRRARVVGNRVYYGGKPDANLLQSIREAVGNEELDFVYDDHEKRLAEDVKEFRSLIRRSQRQHRNQN